MAILRLVLGVIIGVAVGIGVVTLGDALNHRFFPPPPEVQITNPEAIRDYMQSAPVLSLLGLPVTWTIAAFAAAFAAAKIGARRWAGWISGAVVRGDWPEPGAYPSPTLDAGGGHRVCASGSLVRRPDRFAEG